MILVSPVRGPERTEPSESALRSMGRGERTPRTLCIFNSGSLELLPRDGDSTEREQRHIQFDRGGEGRGGKVWLYTLRITVPEIPRPNQLHFSP